MSDTASARPTIIDDADHDADLDALRQVIADIEAGFNTNDASLGVEHFAANGTVVNAVGTKLIGWDALLDAHQKGYAHNDEYVSYTLADVTFLRPDVAIAHKHAVEADAEGALVSDEVAMVALYVFVKEEGRWWIAARANVLTAR
jgi:uncharacterized protein (TIGR02246 family)